MKLFLLTVVTIALVCTAIFTKGIALRLGREIIQYESKNMRSILFETTQCHAHFLGLLLPGSNDKKVCRTKFGNYRRIRWAADSHSGHVEDGDDTLGLRDGLIQYPFPPFPRLPNES